MHMSNRKPRPKQRKDRIRTLCTLDTYELNFADSHCKRGKQNDIRNRNCPYPTSQPKSTTNKKVSAQHQRSQFSAYNCSRVRESSQANRGQRAMSISQSNVNRVRTDCSELQLNGTRNIAASLKKKLVFPTEDSYKFDCWQIVRKICENNQEEVLEVHHEINKKERCVMLKTKHASVKREYERELKACNQLQLQMKSKDRSCFQRVRKIFKERKEWAIITDKHYHATWENDQLYMFVSGFKSNQGELQLLAKQIAKSIELLSKYNYAHSDINLESLYFPICKNSLKMGENVKLGNLRNMLCIDSKESFLSMPNHFRTPPEILNFIMFQCREQFDRDYLDVISKLEAGWQIDMWALGVLILQLLNGGPLTGEGSERLQLIPLQKELTIRYSYLLINLDSNFKLLLSKMLSPFPSQRPHPRDLLRLL